MCPGGRQLFSGVLAFFLGIERKIQMSSVSGIRTCMCKILLEETNQDWELLHCQLILPLILFCLTL